MTIDSKEIIKEMLENNGAYPGDPQAYSVWSYANGFNGSITYKVCMTLAVEQSALQSPFVHAPVLLWNKIDGLTEQGKEILNAD
jgi:hypothetical protein